jgi:hypothetical protein
MAPFDIDQNLVDLAKKQLSFVLLTVGLAVAVSLSKCPLNSCESQRRLFIAIQAVFRIGLKNEQIVDIETTDGNSKRSSLFNQLHDLSIIFV